jgi:hypothetical protein
MTANFKISPIEESVRPELERAAPSFEALAALQAVAKAAESDPAAALIRVHESAALHALQRLSRERADRVHGWSRPRLHDGRARLDDALVGAISGGRLAIRGRQPFHGVRTEGLDSALIVLDEDASRGGYLVACDAGEHLRIGESIFDRSGFRIDEIEIAQPLSVGSFQPIAARALQDVFDSSALVEEYLHAALDYGLLQGFSAAARTHVATRTRPWQGQSLAKATDDPHLVRRYGEYVATQHALEELLADATNAVAVVQADWRSDALGEAKDAVATARAFAILAGRSIINGTIELLGASATSERYGFDLFWRDFTAHALAHPPLWPSEVIGSQLLAPKKENAAR